jgi:predicted AAA+ superfamily ATPase
MATNSDLLPRLLAAKFAHAATVMPVIVVTGSRQTGKSTLVWTLLGEASRLYQTLETPAVLHAAQSDPETFLQRAEQFAIDEVQRAPELLLAIKTAVDNDHPRRPGRFVLTGSANLLLLRHVNESLAGRAVYLTLHPLTRREQLGFGTAGIWQLLLDTPVKEWRDLVEGQPAPEEDWRALVRRGGYPTAAYELHDDAARALWFEGYAATYLQRDVPDISDVADIPTFDQLLRLAAVQVGTVVNLSQLGRDAGIPQSTASRYANVMETSYQLVRLPAFATNATKVLVKSPKWYWADAGLAWWLGGGGEPRGEHFENVVLQDLLAWRDARLASSAPPRVYYWRTAKGAEVDFVIQDGTTLLPIEVKTTRNPSTKDLRGMQTFFAEYGDRVRGGVVLHGGADTFWIGSRILAAPWWKVL